MEVNIFSLLENCNEDTLKEIKVYLENLLSHHRAKVFDVIGYKKNSHDALSQPLSIHCSLNEKKTPIPDDKDVYEFDFHMACDLRTRELAHGIMTGKFKPGKYWIEFRKYEISPYNLIYLIRQS